MPKAAIIIVGGGAAGLAAAGALKHHGLNAVILDRDSKTGNIWRNRYDRLHLHTIRGLSHMPYYRMPSDYPRYPSKDQFADYMQKYVDHFNLNIEHSVEVTKIHKQDDSWAIDTKSSDGWTAPIVIVATGLNSIPYIPNWAYRDHYSGQFLHSTEYTTGKEFADKRVLVIGCGNSGAEICVDLVENGASQVACSIRTFPSIVPRDFFGLPIHALGVGLSLLPGGLKDKVAGLMSRIQLGNLTKYGMKSPQWFIFKDGRIPMIDVGFVKYLKKGMIEIRPDIKDFGETGVTYQDDHHPESFDVVIAATGFRSGLQQILDVSGIVDEDGNLLVPCGEPNQHQGLWFIGLSNSPAGILMAARMQARKIAKAIARQQ
ncbi:MAG: NAD(P)/FAD-dependent oxidoreductase [Anaerolineae bacterium]|nr:NAD(P)/FAD-dependent oxidoreductase [Anaerolineae bacterium]